MGFATRYLTRCAPSILQRFAGTTSLVLILDEIVTVFWQRRGRGVGELIRFPFRFLKYFVCTALVFAVLRRNAFFALALFTWFRRVDDMIDGDTPLPPGLTAHEYRAQKSALLRTVECGASEDLRVEDILLVKGLAAARLQGVTVLDELVSIWEVMEWECLRQESGHMASRSELVTQTVKLDRAVLRVTAKACRGNIERLDMIMRGFTGSFTRADWLDDMIEDLQRGVINIPSEAISQYNVELKRVLSCRTWDDLMAYAEFALWYRDEVQRSRQEWREVHTALGENFGGVFRSKVITWAFARLTVGKVEPQFERAALRAV
jgi:hypothetical protein